MVTCYYFIVTFVIVKSMVVVEFLFFFIFAICFTVFSFFWVTVFWVHYFARDLSFFRFSYKVYGFIIQYLSFFIIGQLIDVIFEDILWSGGQHRDFFPTFSATEAQSGVDYTSVWLDGGVKVHPLLRVSTHILTHTPCVCRCCTKIPSFLRDFWLDFFCRT